MRPLFWATLAGATIATGPARAQAPDAAFAPPGAIVPMGPIGGIGPIGTPPAFSSPYGGSQGYGYSPYTYAPAPGLHFLAYSDGTVSSPYRPGSLNVYPPLGYFATGEGPYLFPPRPRW